MTRKKTNATTYDDVLSFDGVLEYPAENVTIYNGRTYAEGEARLLDDQGKFVTNVELTAPLNLTYLTPDDFAEGVVKEHIYIRVSYSRTWEIPRSGNVDPCPVGIAAITLGNAHIDNPNNRYELTNYIESFLHERELETHTRTVDNWTTEEPGDD